MRKVCHLDRTLENAKKEVSSLKHKSILDNYDDEKVMKSDNSIYEKRRRERVKACKYKVGEKVLLQPAFFNKYVANGKFYHDKGIVATIDKIRLNSIQVRTDEMFLSNANEMMMSVFKVMNEYVPNCFKKI